ncbi:Glutamine--fructose-6-phosphate aminotransferase [isomerizing] [BD1-7 clade bacterium]|uniref:Glutamine--fructose-6-phosphate aminotransferase [isomerizing] n=1 Tax=BD1-7 clade bacterium TaxID=2029982 RepID=A0A5S9MXY4_9GAMM|nr:Glutamine--fructose-6-phosphate aminotransferase [isomerizing] [BD1-7 clade bacterium]CAA0083114.1 Glutamine--fructose-6-phosphate aminotransferase [isomerizing] [BD1-7 clade bacterium]
MCGIVGAVANRNVSKILLEGLKRLEYRGYDSAGLAVVDDQGALAVCKRQGKVVNLEHAVEDNNVVGHTGIAHTRWATHGKPSQKNAHPHASAARVAVVHNGIIENFAQLREQLEESGYHFESDTDTEVIVHLLHQELADGYNLLDSVQRVIPKLEGAYGLATFSIDDPNTVVVARSGSPLVIGVGIEENFIASDQLALRQVTDQFVYLEEGDIAEVRVDGFEIYQDGTQVEREKVQITAAADSADKGEFRHFMLKEIYEQSAVIKDTLQGRINQTDIVEQAFGADAKYALENVKAVQIVACGTSYHAATVAKYWIEQYANIVCSVEVASEFRYRKVVVQPNTLLLTISQSGETADTLAALRLAKTLGYISTMTVCNVAQSSLVRESDIALMTHAGPEIGVASTKAFTTQLTALLLLTVYLAKHNGMKAEEVKDIVEQLHRLPELIDQAIELNDTIESVFESFADKHHALFLGRGIMYPVAMEGALKLKEISYIHAEAYPAGELKHGPLALVDDNMPVVAVAPNDELLEKLKSNLEEVQARGGRLFVFADQHVEFASSEDVELIKLPNIPEILAPIIFTIPLQLLSYHVALLKGTDVDQPRNLAKSVTVE